MRGLYGYNYYNKEIIDSFLNNDYRKTDDKKDYWKDNFLVFIVGLMYLLPLFLKTWE